jgi:hypothetical protein
MLAQFLFLLLLFAVGLLASGIVRRRIGIALVCLLAFPLGSAIWVLLAVALLVSGLPYTKAVMHLGLGMVALASAALGLRQGVPSRREMVAAAAATALFASVAGLALRHNYTFCSDDSWGFIIWSKALANPALSAEALRLMVYSCGIFVPALQSAAAFHGFDYLYAHVPVLTFWFLLCFAYLTFAALRESLASRTRAAIWTVCGLLLLAANYFFVFQAFFLATNLTTGIYLFLAVVLLCSYLREPKVEWLALGTLFLCCFSILRLETAFLALLVWLVVLSSPKVRLSSLSWCYGGYTIVVAAWFLKAMSVGGWHFVKYGSPRLVIGIMLALSLVWLGIALRSRRLARLWSMEWSLRLPAIALYGLAVATVLFTALRPEHAATTAKHLLVNTFAGSGRWGVTWIAISALALLASWLPPWRCHKLLVTTIAGSLLLIYIGAFFRAPYRIGWGDSANRMLLHVLPLTCFYLVTRYGHNLRPRPEEQAAPAEEAGPR